MLISNLLSLIDLDVHNTYIHTHLCLNKACTWICKYVCMYTSASVARSVYVQILAQTQN